MFRYSISWYIFAFTLLESIIKTHLTAHDSSHGFVTNNQRYFDDDLGGIHEEIASGLRAIRINDGSLKLQLKFEPAFLDFKLRPLGVPHLEKVTLFNVDSNRSIDMTSISGSTVHFHSSFFEDKKIPPMGNTSFNVVFLGREEGFVESSLFIHTTEGHFKYEVKGSSVYSPYRLRPIVGIKLPINASFTPLIYMHNPHTEPIQIVEVYSSGGDFHLELPSGELEGPKDMWEIPPLSTKAVIRVRFQAKSEQNHTAYVRIKVNSSEEILVVPLEVEVSANGGIFHPHGSVDFGVGGSLDLPKQVELCVLNPLKKAVRIHSVATTSEAVKVSFDTVKLMPANKGAKSACVKIGTLTLDWQTAFRTKDYSGKIAIKYKHGKGRIEVPYYLTVLEGGISYDPLITRYFINDKSDSLSSRTFKVTNNFLSPVRIINFTLPEDAQNFFKIENFKPSILKPEQEVIIFTIKLKNGVSMGDLRVNSFISIKTNISDVIVPLLSYNGRLHVRLPFKSKDYSLDLGLLSFETTKNIHFLVANNNPVAVAVKHVTSSIPMTSAVMLGCGRGDYGSALLQVTFQNLSRCTNLNPEEYAIIQLVVQTHHFEGQVWGDVQIETQYENLSIPVHFKAAPGKLEIGPDRLVFDQCFPGKICSHPIRVHSTFNDPMIIEDIISLPPDERLSSKHSGHISAKATKVVGHLYLDPSVGCGNECYNGLQHDTTAQWLKTLSLPKSSADFDLNLVNTFYNRYLNLTSNGSKKWQNLTLRLDTSEVRGHIFKSRVKMSWPSLLAEQERTTDKNKSVFTFPLTQIGNISYQNITIRNPSSYNLVVQLVMEYPDVQLLCEGLPNNLIPPTNDYFDLKTSKHGFFFHQKHNKTPLEFGEALNLDVHPESVPVLLTPNQNFTFLVGFKSFDTAKHSVLIFMRNNLTILEIIRLEGQGAYPLFKFGNRKPGSVQPLSFELTEKHLKDCEREKQFRNPSPNLTVKRSFTARNIGDVTIYINGFYINNLPCEGYGFKVLNCAPFVLHSNGTKKIDIAFTPDLTLSKVTRSLILDTSLNFRVNYTLYTTIPPYYLNLCASLIMRPSWETYLSHISTVFMLVLFGFIALLAVLDAEKIKKQTLRSLVSSNNLSTQPVLDLRLVGQQTRAEIRSVKTDDKKTNQDEHKDKKHEDANNKTKEDKYPVLIPAIGKSKKKLCKKNSNETTAPIVEPETQKKLPEVQNKSKAKSVESKVDDKKFTKERNKTAQEKFKRVTKNTVVPVYEEETSSTTTDCSSNNDENDKEDQRNPKVCSIKKPVGNNNKIEPLQQTQEEIDVNKRSHPKMERKKSGPKIPNKIEKTEKANFEGGKRTNRGGKDKKDKQFVNRKSSDKNNTSLKSCNSNEKRESPSIRLSPSISTPVWGENRATFSDVVARSEPNVAVTITNTRPLAQTQTAKPTMYVEPYKQTSTELGPIGSRRIDFWQDGEVLGMEEQINQSSNSFFSNAHDFQTDPVASSGFLEDFSAANENWGHNSSPVNYLEGSDGSLMQNAWDQNMGVPNTSSYWNSAYTPLAESLPTTREPPTIGQHQSGYLWGSSSVWQPWAPAELPKTPTRTPPGFDLYAQRKREEPPTQPRETYNPFGVNNLWPQQEPKPWNYPGQ